MVLYFTPTDDAAGDRRIRRMQESGEVERIVNGMFFKQEGETKEVELPL